MKKVRLDIKINVPDSFQPGECNKCPLNVRKGWEPFPGCYQESLECRFGFNQATCPLEEVKQ